MFYFSISFFHLFWLKNSFHLLNPIFLFSSSFSLWWPSFVILLYIFSVIPTLIIKRSMQSALFGPSYIDLSIFLTMGFIISSFGLPIVLKRAQIVSIFIKEILDFFLLIQFQLFCLYYFVLSLSKFKIELGAAILTICGNIVVYLTIFGYFLFLDPDETTYGGMA